MNKISDSDLKLIDIPENNNLTQAGQFAHSIDKLDTFEKIAEISKKVKSKINSNDYENLTLRSLRISLFFYFRALRHTQSDPDKDLINKHLELIKQRLK